MRDKFHAFFFALFCVFRGEYCISSGKKTKKERQAKGEKSLPPEKEGELESFIISGDLRVFLTPRGVFEPLETQKYVFNRF